MMLYLRMFITLVISLFTTRIVFNALGLSDLGIYNVVGGVLSLLGILTSTMTVSAQRFIAFDLGVGDRTNLRITFKCILFVQVILCIIIFIIAETIGLWFVNNHLNIPSNRMGSANIVYQVAIMSMILGIVKSPFSAAVVAHEKMSIYAYFAIVDVSIKLLIVFILTYVPSNRLIIYAFLLLLSNLIDFLITVFYSLKNFDECTIKIEFNKIKSKEIFSFSGWTLMGQTSFIATEQFVNIFINWFFGTIANGARDIALRINGVIVQFVSHFQMALGPSIVKGYASGDIRETVSLVIFGTKLSFIIMLSLITPIIVLLPNILNVWLGQIPEYTVGFTQLILINAIVETLAGPINRCIQATGKIKSLQIISSIITIVIIPSSYFLLHQGYSPYCVYFSNIIINGLLLFIRIKIMCINLSINFMNIINSALIPCFVSASLSLGVLLWLREYSTDKLILILSYLASFVLPALSSYRFCLNIYERNKVLKMIKMILRKFLVHVHDAT